MVVFKVPSMRCGGCAKSVAAAVRGVDPTADIQVDLGRREVTVKGAAGTEILSQALREAGFEGERLAA